MALLHEKTYTIEDLEALPEGTRAELIDGVMYMMASPTWTHQRIILKMSHTIDDYLTGNTCQVNVAPFDVYLEDGSVVEPDILVVCDPSKLSEQCCTGSPDWVIEVLSPSTAAMDYVIKMNKYRENGVREYWIIVPDRRQVQVYNFSPLSVETYSFSDKIPVGIYDGDLTICLEKMGF